MIKFKVSQLANKYLTGLYGIEIGAAAHNPFNLNAINIDYAHDNGYKQDEIKMCGEYRKVDLISYGDDLPFKDSTLDFVLTSHVFEHFWDPIKTLKEWNRVIKSGGYIFMIVPHLNRTNDRRSRTTYKELVDRHNGLIPPPLWNSGAHYSFWITEDVIELCTKLGYNVIDSQDVDDKVGNGFTIVIQVQK